MLYKGASKDKAEPTRLLFSMAKRCGAALEGHRFTNPLFSVRPGHVVEHRINAGQKKGALPGRGLLAGYTE